MTELHRRALGVGAASFVLLLCALPAAASSTARPEGAARVHTLVRARSPILAFAQGDGQIAWIETADPARSCGELHVRIIATGREARLALPVGECNGGFKYFAFNGGRAIWDESTCGESVCYDQLQAAGLHDRKITRIAEFQADSGDITGATRVTGMAAAGATLIYWTLVWNSFVAFPCTADCGLILGGGSTFLVHGRSSIALPDVPPSSLLAVAGDRIAVVPASRRGCACSGDPSWSPDGRSIVFDTLHEAPHYELAAVPADGGEARQLTTDSGDDVSPAWSPDGTAIAYAGGGAISVVNADGSGMQKLAGSGSEPAWSPDGTRIAFAACSGGPCGIFVVDRATASVRQVTQQETDASSPSWSPDGTKLVFVAGPEIRVVNADGSGERTLTAGVSPTWSPDGSRIAYTASRQVRVVDVNGSGDRKLADGGDPAWSRNGATIAYAASDGHDLELYAVDAGGGVPRQLTSNLVDDYAPDWSPDGTRLTFLRASLIGIEQNSGYTREIYVMNADGSGQRQLTSLSPDVPAATVEIRTLQGRFVRRLSPGGSVAAVALSSDVVALLVHQGRTTQVRVYDARTGALRANFSVSAPTAALSAAGSDVVFAAGRTIRLVDARLRRSLTLATANSLPIGLSIDGRRVAWAENAGKDYRIRSVLLPGH